MAMTVTNNLNAYATGGIYATGNAKQAAESKKSDETAITAEKNESQKDKAAEYYSYLQKNYDCVRDGKVSISGSYLKECASNSEKAKSLEEDLALYKELSESGRINAEANARALGGRLISYEETWSYDSKGNLTVTAQSTVVSGDPAKEAAEKKAAEEEKAKKKQEKKLAEKKAEDKQAEKKADNKEEKEQLMEKLIISKTPITTVSAAYHPPFDQSV